MSTAYIHPSRDSSIMPILRSLRDVGTENYGGVDRADKWIDNLMQNGVTTIEDLVMCDRLAALAEDCLIPFEVLNSWCEWIKCRYSVRPTTLYDAMMDLESKRLFNSFGCKKFDEVFGGIPSGIITQISGDEASGKTQLCHSLTVMAALKGRSVLYIDTESTFSAERVANIIKTLSPNSVFRPLLDKISVAQVFDVNNLFKVLHDPQKSMTQTGSKPSIVIIDSILGVLIPHAIELRESGEKEEQVRIIGDFIKVLKTMLINDPSLSIVTTIGNSNWFSRYWNNAPNFKLHLSVGYQEANKMERKIEIQRSYVIKKDMPKIFNFTIQNPGITD